MAAHMFIGGSVRVVCVCVCPVTQKSGVVQQEVEFARVTYWSKQAAKQT